MSEGARLLDVNILVALLWPRHVHHNTAQRWFATVRAAGWATCPLTQLGCVRVLAAPAVSQGMVSAGRAAGLLTEILSESHHVFWPDDLPLSDNRFLDTLPHLQGRGQLTDRYLLALAAARQGTLATLDQSATASLPAGSPLLGHIELVVP